MLKFVYSLLLTGFCITAIAQQNRFIYIQTENKQPFYVKIDKKVYSSAPSGYVIIPKLIDGTYNLSIGFPKNETLMQNMKCTINQKDAGYLLKNFGEKGWGLFNLQTLDVIMATTNVTNTNVVKENKTDAFSNMLSDVVRDPSIKQVDVVVEQPKPVPVPKEEVKIQPVETVIIKEEPVQIKPEIQTATITRTLYNVTADGAEMVYIDKDGNDLDTIRIFIPAEKAVAPEKKEEKKEIQEEVKAEAKPAKETVKEEKFIDIELQNPNEVKKPDEVKVVEDPKQKEKVKAQPVVSKCAEIASNDDFLKLRKKMAAADSDDEMVSIAKKTFKTKCFNTSQLKNLGFLFLKDEGKYQFFDAAYPYVSDKEEFAKLQDQLNDDYYINRFKVMIQ